MIRPCSCDREMRSVAYSPASTNSTHDARTAASLAGVDLERLLPRRRHALQPLGVVRDGSMSPTSIFTPLPKISAISSRPCLSTYSSKTLRIASASDRLEHLPLRHLMAAHHVQLELAQRRRVEVSQVADARHGRLLAQTHAALPGAGDHRAVVGDAEAGADARLVIDVLRLARADADLLDDLPHEVRHDAPGSRRPGRCPPPAP